MPDPIATEERCGYPGCGKPRESDPHSCYMGGKHAAIPACHPFVSPAVAETPERESVERFWREHSAWSQATFGTDAECGPVGPLKHLRKEADEAVTAAENLTLTRDDTGAVRAELREEIADCLFLTIDAARRAGMTLADLLAESFRKLEINKARTWLKPTSDEPVEHVR
jgi:NTP pyrophosphatase (non-canonical NTP hydrolase)